MRKTFWNSLFLISLSFSEIVACTDFMVAATDGSRVVGRSLEFAEPLNSEIIVHPRGEARESKAPNNQKGASWTSKYGFMAVIGLGLDFPFDGMNEKGLSMGLLWMPESVYNQVPQGQSEHALLINDIGTWLLGNFASVEEAKQALSTVYVWGEEIKALGGGILPPLHLSLHDAQGHSAVVEFIQGEKQITDNPVHVLTNAPTFAWHLTNLGNYLNLRALNSAPLHLNGTVLQPPGQGSGFLGIPGDWTPPSRFVRIAAYKNFVKAPKDALSATILAIHLLNTVDIPLGDIVERQKEGENLDYTQWIVVKDLTNKMMTVRSYENPNLYLYDLNKVDLNPGSKVLRAPINTKTLFVDATSTLKPQEATVQKKEGAEKG